MDSTVESIYLKARCLPVDEQARFLDESCTEQPMVKRAIEALLADEANAHQYFDRLSNQFGGLLSELEEAEQLPPQLGDYKPLRLLGRGGMGAVYLAIRSDGEFDKEVAIKVLPAQLADADARLRFLQERQILARLEHPNISRLLDGGVTPDGLPYFVMDYVNGLALDRYCDTHQLSVDQRLALFLQVCEAVQYAHRNLVLHRDIKPGNILVDETAQVHLLDFGVAKILHESGLSQQTTRLPMTPRYASPEQLLGQPISTAADVYALGVLLYYLLTGAHPHELVEGELEQSLQRLSSQEAPLASQRLQALQQSSADGARNESQLPRSGTNPSELIERLNGDLDNILAKALRLSVAERYTSAVELADDIRRHLSYLPVLARPHSMTYLASRFVRRHWLPVALSTTIATLLLVVAGIASWSAWRTAKQAEIIAVEQARGDATKEFLVSIFRAVHPNQAQGEVVTARQLIDSGSDRVRTELAEEPELQAELLNTFADIYSLLGEYPLAEALWTDELLLREQLPNQSGAPIASALDNLSRIASAQGKHQQAVTYAQRALAIRQTINDPLGLADSRFRIARLAYNANDLDKAEAGYRQVLEVFSEHPQAEEKHTMTLTLLGRTLRQKGQHEQALEVTQQALATQLARHGENNALTAQILDDLGSTQRALQQTIEAEKSYQRALQITETLFGPDHRDVAFALSGLAALAETNNNFPLAEQRYRRALDIFQRALGASHPNIGVTQMNLGALYRRWDDCGASEKLLRQGLKVMHAALPSHGSVALGQQDLAACLLQNGQTEEAEKLLLVAYEAQLAALGEGHKNTRSTAADLADLYHRLGQPLAAGRFTELAKDRTAL